MFYSSWRFHLYLGFNKEELGCFWCCFDNLQNSFLTYVPMTLIISLILWNNARWGCCCRFNVCNCIGAVFYICRYVSKIFCQYLSLPFIVLNVLPCSINFNAFPGSCHIWVIYTRILILMPDIRPPYFFVLLLPLFFSLHTCTCNTFFMF